MKTTSELQAKREISVKPCRDATPVICKEAAYGITMGIRVEPRRIALRPFETKGFLYISR